MVSQTPVHEPFCSASKKVRIRLSKRVIVRRGGMVVEEDVDVGEAVSE